MGKMTCIFLESPYSGDVDRNVRYAALCVQEAAVLHNECAYASHLIMTQHPRASKTFCSDYDAKWDILDRD